MRFYQAGQFEHDAMNDKLPTVSWILPTSYQSEHPDYMPAAGANFISDKVNAIAANPDVWAKTLFILIYDENDGLFDHVTPPTAPKGTPGEYITVDKVSDPIGLGVRVPCILISPWTVGGFVDSKVHDHTSVTRLLELITGVKNKNISAWRRKTVGDFTTALGGKPGRFPRLPDTVKQLELAEKRAIEFPLPPIPAKQTFPVQGPGSKPAARGAHRSGSVTL
jgi:phospholipase C